MTEVLKKEVKVIVPASFVAYEYRYVSSSKDLVLVISQTGYSTNAIAALKKLKELNIKSVGITSNLDSDFKDYADTIIDYGVGVETVGYVTKGVTTLVVFLMLFALEMAKVEESIDDTTYLGKIGQMKVALESHPDIIKQTDSWIDDNIKSLSGASVLYFVAYGSNFGVALEGALKFGETVLVPTMVYEMEEYIHGNNLQLTPNYSVIVLDNGDHTTEKAKEVFRATSAVTDRVYMVASDSSEDKRYISVPLNGDETMNPLYSLPVVQTLSANISSLLDRKQHPLIKEFKKTVQSKSENYEDID